MYDMETILTSIENGGRKQALRQLEESDYNFYDLQYELIASGRFSPREALTMLNIAINSGYISFNPANLKES